MRLTSLINLLNRRVCTSWRFVVVAGHDGHDRPGECRECWQTCTTVLSREEWQAGIIRCDDCVQSLVHCPLVTVRRALLDEKNLPERVLRVLVTDRNGPVSMKALKQIEALEAKGKAQRSIGIDRDPFAAVELPLAIGSGVTRREARQHQVFESRQQQQQMAAQTTSVWGDRR